MHKKIAILGSTGSIGVNTLQVVAQYPDRFEVVGLAAQRNITRLEQQIRQFHPAVVAVADEASGHALQKRCAGLDVEILIGEQGTIQVATHPAVELVVSAIVGFAGLVPTYHAILAEKDIALANKETLVVAGALIVPEVTQRGVALLPVDSEHNAIFQSLQGHQHHALAKIVLTCSGGPFRTHSAEHLHTVSLEDALRHPNWAMGQKISIDSATLMNKALEVIEAHWLFGVDFADIDVLVHPQSVVHSLVEYVDGSLIAQLGVADMKIPIAYALAYPERLALEIPRLNLAQVSTLTFETPDVEKFPCLRYGYQAGETGGTLPAVLNAANEVAVELFLRENIAFMDIPQIIRHVMDRHETRPVTSLADLIEVDEWARREAQSWIGR
ncbi:1-deoxy-D-xylulose-5-phosphate reductoisomerase [candidate division KSB3 bacterium]|uniref:1-deoxy-D-xylulose 5-phosphate reductoisomerase n=1 Tax=candidate division KSB3 bacterium TaxID=2044937 RepID=A0A9D5JYB9_9BACT|nr:1-deoxy-D-xylulose-5-phosphate reductoisomerase [candidate division KSB3 bacterium]MBD3325961.1 1-deoxy-D-xylulose-5-phosphate reductoisomerase [candidate division KSB3 bacterium]